MMIRIRNAHLEDAGAITRLLGQLGYVQTVMSVENKLKSFAQDQQQVVLVAEFEQEITGFLSLTLIAQIAVDGDFARIAYLCVDEKYRGKRIGQTLLTCAEDIARKRGCNRLELHSSDHRKQAHQFYLSQGYEDAPKYFRKFLTAFKA